MARRAPRSLFTRPVDPRPAREPITRGEIIVLALGFCLWVWSFAPAVVRVIMGLLS